MGHHGHHHHHHGHHGHHHHGHNTVVVTRVVPSPVVTSPVAHPQTYYVAPTGPQVPYPQTGYPPQNAPYTTTYPPQQHFQNYPPPTQNYNNAPYPSTNQPNAYPGQPQHTTYPPPQNNQNAPFQNQSTYPPTSAPFSANTAPVHTEKRGWLTKEGEWVRSWKRRWFVLKNNTIYYYETETTTESKGSIVLTPGKSVVYDAHRPGFKYMFEIKPTPEGRVYAIYADTEEEKNSWMHAIQQAVAIPEPMTQQYPQHQYPAPSAPPQFM